MPHQAPEPDSKASTGEPSVGSPSSHDSSIIAVEKPDFFLTVTLLFVFTSIFFGAIVNTVLYAFLLLGLFAIPVIRRKRLATPKLLTRMMESIVNRVLAYPLELVLVVGIGGLVVLEWLSLGEMWTQLALSLLLIAGYTLSRRGSLLLSGYGHRRWQLFRRRQPRANPPVTPPQAAANTVRQSPQPAEHPTAHDTATMHRAAWEDKQRKRWEEWMQEELDRLNGEYKSDHGG